MIESILHIIYYICCILFIVCDKNILYIKCIIYFIIYLLAAAAAAVVAVAGIVAISTTAGDGNSGNGVRNCYSEMRLL